MIVGSLRTKKPGGERLGLIELNGEKAYHGDLLSSADGEISNDMTAEYGPEEYITRRR